MIVNREDFKMVEIKKELEKVKGLILSRLNVYWPYYGRLKATEFEIETENERNTHGVMKFNMEFNVSDSLKGFVICLFINCSDPIEWIRLIIAHELYHLLFAIDSVVKIDGYCLTDNTYSMTAVQRCYLDGEKTIIYGRQMEENLCWVLAFDTLKELNKDKKYMGDIYDKFCTFEKNNLSLIRNIIKAFSLVKSADLSKIKLDESMVGNPYNEFLYCISYGNISRIVLKFDITLGYGMWRNLMYMVDDYYDYQDVSAREKAENLISEYEKLSLSSGIYTDVKKIS